MKKTIEQLREEHRKLLGKEDVERQEEIKRKEKRTLKRNIRRLKHPRVVKVVRVAKQSAEGVGIMAKWAGKKIAPVVKEGAVNIARNMYEEAERMPTKRRTVRVKKVKKKSPKKKKVVRVKKVKRRKVQRQTPGIPNFENFFE